MFETTGAIKWDEFKKLYKSHFISADDTASATRELEKHRQTGSVDEYLATFREILIRTGITDPLVIQQRFLNGLKEKLREKVALVEFPDYTKADGLETLYARAQMLDSQERTIRAMLGVGESRPLPPTPTKDPNAMDVDAL